MVRWQRCVHSGNPLWIIYFMTLMQFLLGRKKNYKGFSWGCGVILWKHIKKKLQQASLIRNKIICWYQNTACSSFPALSGNSAIYICLFSSLFLIKYCLSNDDIGTVFWAKDFVKSLVTGIIFLNGALQNLIQKVLFDMITPYTGRNSCLLLRGS